MRGWNKRVVSEVSMRMNEYGTNINYDDIVDLIFLKINMEFQGGQKT